MIARFQLIWQLWRYLGPVWLAYRIIYAFKRRTGLLRRKMPATSWDKQLLSGFLSDPSLNNPITYWNYRCTQSPSFFFSPQQRSSYQSLLVNYDVGESTPIRVANKVALGYMLFFSQHLWKVGMPPNWHRNVISGETVPANLHWSKIPDFRFNDIKVIWEPSRFSSVYPLVRAYWRTGNELYAELFWKLIEDWREHNPPNQGPNWKCGQEISFRIMAWVFGLYGFLAARATTPERVTALAQMIAVFAHRIEANMSYALSQRNNHGISEGIGLWTVGILFPEFHRAEIWIKKGRQVLERLGRKLIYDDGSFVQHSVNYHRLMLHDYIWAVRLGDLNGYPLSYALRERLAKATEFLYQIQDLESGRVPNYGQNDGSLILPLNNCDYQDFRPVIQASYYLSTGKRCYSSGPWDEDLLWLFGPEALRAEVTTLSQRDFRGDVSGYYTVRSKESFVFIRCATFQDRPGQADMLHMDLWWRGQNIAIDPGTYSYNAPKLWNNPLAHTAYHNTVTVDDMDQMNRVGKFLWFPWIRSRVLTMKRSVSRKLAYWEGEHDGYQRLSDPVIHRRGILHISEDVWLVLDYLESKKLHKFRLHWLFLDCPCEWRPEAGELILQTPRGTYYVYVFSTAYHPQQSLVRADEKSPRGWKAPYYSYREPALSLAIEARASTTLFTTLFTSLPSRLELNAREIELIRTDWHLTAQLLSKDQEFLVNAIRLTGNQRDTLDIR